MLMETSRSISTGLDSEDVHNIVRVGFFISDLEIVQEVGRSGRGRQNDNNIVTDYFHMLLSCKYFVYLNQRLREIQPSLPSAKVAMLVADVTQMQRGKFLDLLKMIVLKDDF